MCRLCRFGYAFEDFALPANVAGFEVYGLDHTVMLMFRCATFAAEVQPSRWLFAFNCRDYRGHKDRLTPYNRRPPADAGNVGLPDDIFVLTPMVRQIRVIACHARRTRAAKLRPVAL